VIRLAHISDTHFAEHKRPEDLKLVLDAFLEQVEKAGVDLIVHAGDFFDKRSTPAERLMLAEFLQRASEAAPVFGVKGNHDAAGDLELFNHLDVMEPGVRLVDRPTRPGEAWIVDLYNRPEHGRHQFGVMGLPWFDKAHLVATVDPVVDGETTRRATIETAESLLDGLRAEAARVREAGAIPILVSHAMVAGSVTSTGQVIQGITVELSPFALQEVGAEYVALGHVHAHQQWFNGQVAYSGSPMRHNFGEPEPKGWCLVTFDDYGKFVSNEFRELPARQIVLLNIDWFSEGDGLQQLRTLGPLPQPGWLEGCQGALVRFRYNIRAQDLHLVQEDKIAAVILEAGAADVKVEAIVKHEARTRSEAIVTARATIEKIQAYLEAKGESLDDVVMGRITEKLAEIEREAV
jgi:exonuclease SbcD